jgi:hypothetical protein
MADGSTVNIITAVQSESNLPALKRSILRSARGTILRIRWVQVFDRDVFPHPDFMTQLADQRFELSVLVKPGGEGAPGLRQMNAGLDMTQEGFVAFVDDATIVHVDFLRRLETSIKRNPDKDAFVFSQGRFDRGPLMAAPQNVAECQIDGGQAVINTRLIGNTRRNPAFGMLSDYYFIKELYDKDPSKWIFIEDILTYHQYLRFNAPPPGIP